MEPTMLSYFIVAAIATLVGAALTYLYQKKVQSKMIKDHQSEIFETEKSWFKAGWDDAYSFTKH